MNKTTNDHYHTGLLIKDVKSDTRTTHCLRYLNIASGKAVAFSLPLLEITLNVIHNICSKFDETAITRVGLP